MSQDFYLGPLLFNSFVNDILNFKSSKYLLCADDLRMCIHIEDNYKLRNDIAKIIYWCHNIGMIPNVNNCQYITLTICTRC